MPTVKLLKSVSRKNDPDVNKEGQSPVHPPHDWRETGMHPQEIVPLLHNHFSVVHSPRGYTDRLLRLLYVYEFISPSHEITVNIPQKHENSITVYCNELPVTQNKQR
jgi:hypothetical protein